jgi:uncharacterized membrane protein
VLSTPAVLAPALRASLALGVVSAALIHVLASILMPVGPSFVVNNALVAEKRMTLALAMVGAFAVTAALSGLVWFLEKRRTAAGLQWLARLLSPLVLAPLVVALAQRDFGEEISEALVFAVFIVAFEQFLRVSLAAWAERDGLRPPLAPETLPGALLSLLASAGRAFTSRPRLVAGTVVFGVLAQAFYMSLYAIWSHQRFTTYGYDLGQYDSIFTNTLHGHWLAIPALGWEDNWSELVNNHADLGVFYMLPFYALYPRAETLLVMQAVVVASAAIPVYLFAKNRLPTGWAFLLAVGWLGYPPLHGAQLYDVHMQPFGMAFTVWAIAMVDRQKWVGYWIFFTMAIMCREDVSIGLAMLGAFMVLSGARVKTGIASMIVAALFFLTLRFVIMKNTGFSEVFKELFPAGERGFGAIIKTLLTNPGFVAKSLMTWEKFRYVAQLFAPLAFIPVRRPALWLVFVPAFILTLLSTGYLPTIQISFQYISNWAGYAFLAIALVLAGYRAAGELVKFRAAGAALVVGLTLGNLQYGAWQPNPVVRGGFVDVPLLPPSPADRQRKQDLLELMKLVPPDASLAATDRVQPHVTFHVRTYSLKDALYDCDYLLWSDLPGDPGTDRGLRAVMSGEYEIVATRGGSSLAKKKPKTPPPAAPPGIVPAVPPAPSEAPRE